MRTEAICDLIDLWEAWIDLSAGESKMLYVVANVSTGTSRTMPVLVKKSVQGAASSHLILEVLPLVNGPGSRQAEVRYTEPLAHSSQYQQISICAGEDIIASIRDIEVVQ